MNHMIDHFLKLAHSSQAADRTDAACALTYAYLYDDLTLNQRCDVEVSLTMLIDDGSSDVRLALACGLASSAYAPIHLIHSLMQDQSEIASIIVSRSPILTDSDLIDCVALCVEEVQCAIALRPQLSPSVCAALLEIGGFHSCLTLVKNKTAKIALLSLRRLVERFGHNSEMRQLLLNDRRLPADARHALVIKVSQALSDMPIVQGVIGKTRANYITKEACVRACLTVVDQSNMDEYPALIEHLRLSNALTTAFVLRVLINGKISFFSTILAALSAQDESQVKNQLSSGKPSVLAALYRRCGFTDGVAAFLLHGLECWRAVANGRLYAGSQEIARLMFQRASEGQKQTSLVHDNDDLIALIRCIYLEIMCDNARKYAQSVQAA
jgi:uncharacterized protein (DUF2336 family)